MRLSRPISAILAMSAIVTVASNARADEACYNKAQSQSDLTQCSLDDLKKSNDSLNTLYKEMEARLTGDSESRKLLVDAQKKWIAFRDAECTFSTVRSAGGSINPMNVNTCANALTLSRIKDFQTYLNCAKTSGDQSDDCAIPGPAK